MKRLIQSLCLIALVLCLLLILATARVRADPGEVPLYHYGIGDGKLGKPTAFAESWTRPLWVPSTVQRNWPGIALADLPPGTLVKITVVGLPNWADTWPELDALLGRMAFAYVADRPGGAYADAWWEVFGCLAPHWVGVLYVEIMVVR